MRAKYGSVWIAPGGVEGTTGAGWQCSQQNDEFVLLGAEAASFFARGGRATSFPFSVNRVFGTEAAAILFMATHVAELAQQGDLQLFADDALDDDPAAELLEAVLEGVEFSEIRGCSLLVKYTFRGGVFTAPA